VTALLNWAKISPVRGEQAVRRPRRNLLWDEDLRWYGLMMDDLVAV
jgi:hypothetical protein